jgi:hypothetical protein
MFLSNHSHGCPFRPGVFDGCVSISAVQWLCNADNSQHEPRKRLKAFFTQLYKVGLYKLIWFYSQLESAWFQPLNNL